jgi:hypothetical protein
MSPSSPVVGLVWVKAVDGLPRAMIGRIGCSVTGS